MSGIPPSVRRVLETLEGAGYEAWCVGGCVRDQLLGRVPDDWDVTTSALPEETLCLFPGRALPTGLRHGTVTVRTEAMSVEVTTYRCDGAYTDGRHPDSVTFTRSLTEDLRRRDFTVNAMALDLRGRLEDPFGGRADLEAGIVRCVGEPDVRFREDALRVLRGVRFAAVLGFSVESATAESLRRNRGMLENIAAERIRVELVKLLCGAGAAGVLREYPEVFGVFLPELMPLVGFDQRNRHHCFDVWEHTLHSVEAIAPEADLRMTMLLHDVGKPLCFTLDAEGNGHFYGHPAVSREMAADVLSHLKFDGRSRERILTLVEWHDRNIPRTERGIARALRALGEERLRDLLAVKRADNLAQAPEFRSMQGELDRAEALLDGLLARDACFSLRQLAVNGRDLTERGFRGKAVGAELARLLDAVVDGDLPNERAVLLAAAERERPEP